MSAVDDDRIPSGGCLPDMCRAVGHVGARTPHVRNGPGWGLTPDVSGAVTGVLFGFR